MTLSFANSIRRNVLRVLAIAALVALALGVFVVWARVVHTLTSSDAKQSPIGRPQSVVWSNHVFTTESQLRAYLVARGISYQRWVHEHPGATAIFGPKVIVGSQLPTTKQSAKPRATRRAPERVAAKSIHLSARGLPWSTILADGLLGLAVLIAVSAVIPPAVAPRPIGRFYAVPERRILVPVAALAISLGWAVSQMLG